MVEYDTAPGRERGKLRAVIQMTTEARIAAEAVIGSAASWKQKFDAARLKGATETTIKEDAENVIDEIRKRHKGNIGLEVLSEMINVVREAAAV
jgi:hypothetical protein